MLNFHFIFFFIIRYFSYFNYYYYIIKMIPMLSYFIIIINCQFKIIHQFYLHNLIKNLVAFYHLLS